MPINGAELFFISGGFIFFGTKGKHIFIIFATCMNNIEKISATIGIHEYIKEFRNVEHFLGFCRACNGFGKTWACPPFEREIDLERWQYANIFGTKIVVDPSIASRPMSPEELKVATAKILLPIRRSLDKELLELEAKTPHSRALFAGSCKSCDDLPCTRPSGKPCAKPDQMRPSLEAMGFDVGRTTSELLGIELQWSSDTLPQYFTLVYALLTMEPLNN